MEKIDSKLKFKIYQESYYLIEEYKEFIESLEKSGVAHTPQAQEEIRKLHNEMTERIVARFDLWDMDFETVRKWFADFCMWDDMDVETIGGENGEVFDIRENTEDGELCVGKRVDIFMVWQNSDGYIDDKEAKKCFNEVKEKYNSDKYRVIMTGSYHERFVVVYEVIEK